MTCGELVMPHACQQCCELAGSRTSSMAPDSPAVGPVEGHQLTATNVADSVPHTHEAKTLWLPGPLCASAAVWSRCECAVFAILLHAPDPSLGSKEQHLAFWLVTTQPSSCQRHQEITVWWAGRCMLRQPADLEPNSPCAHAVQVLGSTLCGGSLLPAHLPTDHGILPILLVCDVTLP